MDSKSPTTDTLSSSTLRTTAAGRYAPYLTVFVSSACIMIVELVAGRLISRYIGQSLYTWTTIIGVVLAGIAVGNGIGGRLADRWWGRGTLAVQLLLASAGCLLVLGLNAAAGAWPALGALPWPARILAHVTISFLIPSALLGTISPVIAKRALMQGDPTGRTMGNVYASAIAGSILGTFLTGYVLLMWLQVSWILAGAAGTLALLGAAYAVGAAYAAGAAAGKRTGSPAVERGDAGKPGEILLGQIWGPLLAVFMANACLMAVEIVAGRLASRFYGQSIYSWTTVIGVILTGMTLGSYVGGRVADRIRVDRLLSKLFVASSILCMAIPLGTNLAVHAAPVRMLYWPYQTVVYVVLVYFLPSALLGATAPVLARMALFRGRGEGRIVGLVYAFGSAGSIAGTFLAGFYLISAFGTMRTLALVALVLALIAVVYESRLMFSHIWAACCGLLVLGALAPSLPVVGGASRALLLELVTPPNAVFADESQYSFIAVITEDDNPNIRQLTMDQLVHSKADLDNPLDLKYEYMHVYEAVVETAFKPGETISALNLGGGGYVFPRYIELTRPGSYVEVAEIDPQVTEAAYQAFGLPRDTSIKAFNMDARNRVADLARMKRQGKQIQSFDCIFGDSFSAYNVPYHLTTKEFNDQLRELMTDRGIYAMNVIDVMDSAKFLGAVVKTCRETFPYVYVFDTYGRPDKRETYVVVNSMKPLEAENIPAKVKEKHDYEGRLLGQQLEPLVASAPVLTDDFAPVENMLAAVVQYSQEEPTGLLMDTADAYFQDGKYRQAIRKARRALALSPGLGNAYELIGTSLLNLGDLEGAAENIEQVVKIKTDVAEAYQTLIDIYIKMRDYPNAVRAGLDAVKEYPDDARLFGDLGAAYIQAGLPEQAMLPLSRAVEIDPALVTAHNNLATACFKTGDNAGAINHLNRVLEIDPQAKNIQRQLAVAYFNAKDYDKAWEAVKKARANKEQIDPSFVEALSRDSGKSLAQMTGPGAL
ncbi:MAG: fused MFS/spermidine synthase [Candidatus Hydrogenedentes bacterium]|nr:fused MFS/spermidine synthase [Candidatus Hydrogenedentota bacterium]